MIVSHLVQVGREVRPRLGESHRVPIGARGALRGLQLGQRRAHPLGGGVGRDGGLAGRGVSGLLTTDDQAPGLDLELLEAGLGDVVSVVGVLHGLTGGLQLPTQPALVHARAGQLGQLGVGFLDGGGRRAALLEDPVEVLLGAALLLQDLVEEVLGGLDGRQPVLELGLQLGRPLGAVQEGAAPPEQVLELVAGGVAVVHGPSGDGVEARPEGGPIGGPPRGQGIRRQPEIL